MARKNGKSVQTKNTTHKNQTKATRKSPSQICVASKNTAKQQKTGQGPTETPNKDLPCDTETIQQYHLSNMQTNYLLRQFS